MSAETEHIFDAGLPGIVIHWPTCGHCGEDVTIEDGMAYCDPCLISWPSIDEDAVGEPDRNQEGTDVPCHVERPQTRREYDHEGQHVVIDYLPCPLPSGHETPEHRWPYTYASSPLAGATPDLPTTEGEQP